MSERLIKEFMSFVEANPTVFHVVDAMAKGLEKAGFSHLDESGDWKLKAGGKYYITRNGSSIIAFTLPGKVFSGFQISAAHSDSPGLKVKGLDADRIEGGPYIKLNVETYGGLLMAPWFDRPLSLAGRIMVKERGRIKTKLVNIDRDLMIIPNVAIHMNREVNKGYEYNPQVDLLPLLGLKEGDGKNALLNLLAEKAKTKAENILSCDIFVYDRTKGSVLGVNNEFFATHHIDDMECAYMSYKALVDAKAKKGNGAKNSAVSMVAIFDNEEVGSLTKQGADSTFLFDVMSRINEACGRKEQDYRRAVAGSMMISADNAHALHPNHPEHHDPVNKPIINGGIVIKHAANEKYTTDAVSHALFKELCDQAKVPYQEFYNRSDKKGGGTLGNIANAHVSLNTVDIGLPQLAMHSPYETAGTKDPEYLYKVLKLFFEKTLRIEGGYRFE